MRFMDRLNKKAAIYIKKIDRVLKQGGNADVKTHALIKVRDDIEGNFEGNSSFIVGVFGFAAALVVIPGLTIFLPAIVASTVATAAFLGVVATTLGGAGWFMYRASQEAGFESILTDQINHVISKEIEAEAKASTPLDAVHVAELRKEFQASADAPKRFEQLRAQVSKPLTMKAA